MMQFPENTTFTAYSVMRNVSDQNATITPTLYWMRDGAAQSRTLPKLVLAPGTSRNLDTRSLLSAAGIARLNGSVNLILDVLGKPGAALLASGSVDKKNTYVFEVMPHAVLESASKGIGYWSTGNGDDTMVTLWNPADEGQDFVFTLFFSGGHYNLPIHLGPRVTRMFNISELVQNQVPDDEGNIIPASVHEGSGKLSGPLGESQHILVSLEAGIYNVRKATCGYICDTCHGAVSPPDPWITADPWGVAVGGNTSVTFTAQWDTGVQHNLTSGSTWSSSATNIATVNAGSVHGVAAGEATLDASDLDEPLAGQQCGSPPQACPPDTGVGGGGPGCVGCPSSNSLSSLTALSITLLFPSLKTGIGAMAAIQLSPTTTDWNSAQITESLVTSSNTCPTSWGNLCAGSSTFMVGVGLPSPSPRERSRDSGRTSLFGPGECIL